jgi:hypothetical protein
MDWIDRVTDIVKTTEDSAAGWTRLLHVCKAERPSELWDALPSPDVKSDVHAATAWLTSQLHHREAPKPFRGVYLGLDTLNMDDGAGHNLELGATASCDPFGSNHEWVWSCEWYGDRHLIRGLLILKEEYERERWTEEYDFADYALFLGYSGLVLGGALAAIAVREPLLATWGFHDGDLFVLGRRTLDGFERVCEVL